ncbi:hypothetical protein A8990_14034 [Paenibacillus taihuensis]|uniref:Uncharacterized protein n=1 Tax=Paenibacillus taihuensis TaxID=1156355 RepID=A0A3D9QWA1_9BACL|nr:hypothetical protein A8990_14034 [Paenibacillus taihuensis]
MGEACPPGTPPPTPPLREEQKEDRRIYTSGGLLVLLADFRCGLAAERMYVFSLLQNVCWIVRLRS